jgi:hypothetical protein
LESRDRLVRHGLGSAQSGSGSGYCRTGTGRRRRPGRGRRRNGVGRGFSRDPRRCHPSRLIAGLEGAFAGERSIPLIPQNFDPILGAREQEVDLAVVVEILRESESRRGYGRDSRRGALVLESADPVSIKMMMPALSPDVERRGSGVLVVEEERTPARARRGQPRSSSDVLESAAAQIPKKSVLSAADGDETSILPSASCRRARSRLHSGLGISVWFGLERLDRRRRGPDSAAARHSITAVLERRFVSDVRVPGPLELGRLFASSAVLLRGVA